MGRSGNEDQGEDQRRPLKRLYVRTVKHNNNNNDRLMAFDPGQPG